MAAFKPSIKDVCSFFFSLKDVSTSKNENACECGNVRKKSGSSWRNLITHIKESHPDYIEEMKFVKSSSQRSLIQFVDTKSKNIWGWIKVIVGKGVAFN